MIKLQKNLFEGNGPLTQRFGMNPDWYAPFGLKGHNGVDYGIPNGTKLFSCLFGTVTEIYNDTQGYGLYIKIENAECGVIYAHLQKTISKVGNFVTPGQLIGYSNNTGNSTGPHLHFGVFPKPRNRQNGYGGYIDPLDPDNVEWVDELKRPDEFEKEDCEQKAKDYKESRDKWKQKTFQEQEERQLERNDYEKEIRKRDIKIEKLEKYIQDQNKSGESNKSEKQKGVIEMTKKAIWEALKEPLRLLVLSIIPLAVVYFQGLPYEWAGMAVILLRFADKLIHEVGKENENDNFIRGLTRF